MTTDSGEWQPLMAEIHSFIEQRDDSIALGASRSGNQNLAWFMPRCWEGLLPHVGRHKPYLEGRPLYAEFRATGDALYCDAIVGPVDESWEGHRTQLLHLLVDSFPEFCVNRDFNVPGGYARFRQCRLTDELARLSSEDPKQLRALVGAAIGDLVEVGEKIAAEIEQYDWSPR